MPRRLNPVTDLGEAALRGITLRSLDHGQLMRFQDNNRYEIGRHLLPDDRLRHANALVDLVAVVENFTSQRLLKLYPNLTDSDVFSWEKRRASWLRHANVDLTRIAPHWALLQGFIEARNALQHGLGRLTEFQLNPQRRDRVLENLRFAHVPLIGDLIVVDAETVRTCKDTCADFTLTLDNIASR
jgi:hypothetical protein